MFFRKNNVVEIDYIEQNKPSETGKIKEFNGSGVVVDLDKPTFIPFTAVSSIKLIEGDIDGTVLQTNMNK